MGDVDGEERGSAMTADRTTTTTAREARRLLVERLRTDPAFAEQLVTDPAAALAGVDPATLFGTTGDGDDEVRGFLMVFPETRAFVCVPTR
jgi:hypothetical protein